MRHQALDVTVSGGRVTLSLDVGWVSPRYFETLGLPIVRGREFRDLDAQAGADSARVVVSESLARKYWPNEDPVGKRLNLVRGSLEVLGVAKDLSRMSYAGSENPVAHFGPPSAGSTFLLVRFEGGALAAAAVRAALREVNPGFGAVPATLQVWIDDAASDLSKVVARVVALGRVAALTAIAGIYGAVAFAVSQQTRDLNIRVALGAQRQDILREVFVSGGRPVVYGLPAGLWLSLVVATALGSALRNAPFRPDTEDPLVKLGASLLLPSAALLAMWRPARRCAASDPLAALRTE